MRRFLTLVCLLCLAIPAGISISGCTRNPDAAYCNGDGYGTKVNDVSAITLLPQTLGISMAYGQTHQLSAPTAVTCKGYSASPGTYTYGTTNNQLVDVAPSGLLCAGTWNRNSGSGIANYTVCSPPNPPPSTGGLPYATAFVTASAQTVTSNPVEIFVHIPVTSTTLVTETSSSSQVGIGAQCFSQGTQATLDAQACYVNNNNQQVQLCAPAGVKQCPYPSSDPRCSNPSLYFACPGGVTSNAGVLATGAFGGFGGIGSGYYVSSGSIVGTAGQTCILSGFNGGSTGATATVALTGTNTIANQTPLTITAGGLNADPATPPTTAVLSNGTATCSGTATITSTVTSGTITGSAKDTCNLTLFNSGPAGSGPLGATATVALTGANTIASGTALTIATAGSGATSAPTQALLSSGSAICSGTASVFTTISPVPNCTNAIGPLNYFANTASVATISTSTNSNVATITAGVPGTTSITVSMAGSGSSAGYFSTCPPKSISVTMANGSTSGIITQGDTQNLVTTAYDTLGNPLTGLALSYLSTDPIDISVGAGGAITTAFPGVASVYAACMPPSCNPAPTNVIGWYGTGLPVASNPVIITTPGAASDYLWFAAPGQSQYMVPVNLITGTGGALVRLPYVPNSMLMDPAGMNLYFGSPHELMIYNTSTNTISAENPSVPGVVLAVSPGSGQLLINDQARQIFYIYTIAGGATTTFGGLGNAAAWDPDSETLYITDSAALNTDGVTGHTDTLYVYNANTGESIYNLSPSPLQNPLPPGILPPNLPPSPMPANVAISSTVQNPAIIVPAVGAFLRGSPTTVDHTWCPTGTVGNYASLSFFPQPAGDALDVQTDALSATTDGQHILGAALTASGFELSDIGVAVPSAEAPTGIDTPLPCPEASNASGVETLSALPIAPWLNATPTLDPGKVSATAVNRVVPSPQSNLAFITYTAVETNTNAQLPYYVPVSGATSSDPKPGAVGYLTLATQKGGVAPIAPLAGAFTPDSTLFFVSTAGDNMIHIISIPTVISPATPPVDTQQFSPNLPACTPVSAGGLDAGCTYQGSNPGSAIVPATTIAIKPRANT